MQYAACIFRIFRIHPLRRLAFHLARWPYHSSGRQALAALALCLAAPFTGADAAPNATHDYSRPDRVREVVVLDTGIEDWRTLASGVPSGALLVRIDDGDDGLGKLAAAIRGRTGIRVIHVISHGDVGVIELGGQRIQRETLDARHRSLATIRQALAPGADILLAGCDVARSGEGARFIRRLSTLTGADVAGSIDATGNISIDANWALEARTGAIESSLLLSRKSRENFRDRLEITSEVTFGFSKYDGSLGNGAPFSQTIEADGTSDQMSFSQWRIDEFDAPDYGVNMNNGGPESIFADPGSNNFQFVSFTTEVFCGTNWSFDVVGYKDGGAVSGASVTYNLGGPGGPTTRSVGFASVDEVRFENYSTDNGNQCLVIDDIVVDAEVVANTAPGFVNLDATVAFDEATGTPVVIDADAAIQDTELDAVGDYAGSTLTVAREGGANGDDDFGFDTGGGTFGVSGGDLLAGGSTFASFTDSGGTLTVSFNSNATLATPAVVDEVLQSVTYANTGSPAVVEYGLTLVFDDGGLQTSESRPVEVDPELAAIAASTTWDLTELETVLGNLDPIDGRVITESTYELLFGGFQFGDASESGAIASSELQLDQVTSNVSTTGTIFESDESFSLESIDIDNFSSSAQDVTVHAYLDDSLIDSRSFSYGATSGYQTRQFASANAAFSNVDEIRITTSSNDSVALDNIVADQGNEPPTLDLDTGAGGNDASVSFSENTDQGIAATDGVVVTGPVSASDADGTIETVTLTLDNAQGDAGEGLAVDTGPLSPDLGFSISANLVTITRNTATNAELVAAVEAVRYQNNSDTPDTTARSVTVEVTDDLGGAASATATVTVEAGNDTPSITAPGTTLQPDEDVSFDLSGANEIRITDVDAGSGTVVLALSAGNGTLTLGSTTGLAFDVGSNGTASFVVSGTLSEINNALTTLSYLGDADYAGSDSISVTIDDGGNTGTDPGDSGGADSEVATTSVLLNVQQVPDAPTISPLLDQQTNEDTTISGIDFTVDDAETAASAVTVTASSDDQSVVPDGNIVVSDLGGGDRALAIAPAEDQSGTVDIMLVATDGSGLTASATFPLTVLAVNDPPTVAPAISTLDTTVDEDAALASIPLEVDDIESGGAGVTVAASSDNQALVPDGNLSVTDDGGGNRTLDVTLAANENGSANITVTLDDGTDTVDDSFTLTVNPVNDAPAVSLDQGSNTIAEGNSGNVSVATIIIDDDNEDGSTNNLSLTGADAAEFVINGTDLEFAGEADFESKTTYSVDVEVDDPALGATPDDTESFTLNISDVDETPTFESAGPFGVSESDGNGTVVGDVDAVDGDGGATDANVIYAIVGGNTSGAFAIDASTGAITVADATALDFDASPTFSLDVEADDGTNAATATVTVNVSNAAPSTPVDSDGATGGTVAEDAPNGTAVGITADASDPGGGNVSYALIDDAGGRFQINAGTGIVTVADTALIDFESATSHPITVRASDDDGVDSGTTSFTVAVTDINSPPVFTENGPFTVGEAPSNGTAVGDVDANDGDAGATDVGISYSITGGDTGGAFAIDNSGVIEVADGSQIDHESSAVIVLTLEASDGSSTASATVTVNVSNEPPSLPVDIDGAANAVPEDAVNGVTVGVDADATDPAGGTVTFALADDAGGRFAIDGDGVVTVADGSLLDFETATSHTIGIEARDADEVSPTLSVTIAVTDVEDDPTVVAPPDLAGADAIDATGLYTEVDLERLGDASAEDDEDGSITPEPVDVQDPVRLRPGTHEITWSVTDSDGGTATDEQIVEIRPRVGIGPDQTVQEGTSVEVPIELNGDSIDGTMPDVEVEIVDSMSTADAADHDLAAPVGVTLVAGRSASLNFDVLSDGVQGEGPETLAIKLAGTAGNTVLGGRTRTTITIVEDNTPPVVSLSVSQGTNDPAVVVDAAAADPVTITATTRDATATGDMSFAWNAGTTGLIDTDGVTNDETFVFDPGLPGVYEIEVTATDQGGTQQSGSASLRLRVVDTLPPLGSDDSDGDGIDDNDAAEGRSDRDGDGLPDYLDPYRSANTIHQSLADEAGYRIEAEPGLNLALGPVAFARDVDGARVSAGDIADVLGRRDDRENAGGYFDFTIRELPIPGRSVRVVLPQRERVPADAVYRKLGAVGGWMDFIEDGRNALASTPGAEGFCPPPDAPVWTGGLTAGDWCVRLTIEDGGPNDGDGATDGQVTDPGGVAVGTTVGDDGVEASNDGGGSLGPIALLLLLFGTAGYRRARSRGGVQ